VVFLSPDEGRKQRSTTMNFQPHNISETAYKAGLKACAVSVSNS